MTETTIDTVDDSQRSVDSESRSVDDLDEVDEQLEQNIRATIDEWAVTTRTGPKTLHIPNNDGDPLCADTTALSTGNQVNDGVRADYGMKAIDTIPLGYHDVCLTCARLWSENHDVGSIEVREDTTHEASTESTDDNRMPEKYRAKSREWEDKEWLRERYWGEELWSVQEIAEEAGVGDRQIRRLMREHGIPRRVSGFNRDDSMSPCRGFYNGDEAVADSNPENNYEEDYEDVPTDFDWAYVAESTAVSD